MSDSKIISIIPISNIKAVYVNDDNTLSKIDVHLVALLDNGTPELMQFDDYGMCYCPEPMVNFIGYEFKDVERDWSEEIKHYNNKRSSLYKE